MSRPALKCAVPVTKRIFSPSGFTFIEIMVTLVVLSLGIVAIYKTLFSSLDHMSHLNSRLYADVMLDDRIARMERTLRAYKALPFEIDQTESVDMGVKTIPLTPLLKISEVSSFVDILRLDVAYSWQEDGRTITLSRSAYISDYVTTETP